MIMIKAVIFDMDGVIIDSEPEYLKRLLAFLDAKKVSYDDDIYSIVGISNRETWDYVSKLFNGCDPKELQDEYRVFVAERLRPISYIEILNRKLKDVINELKNRDLKIALASSSPIDHIKNVLKECEIDNLFDIVVTGEDFRRSKPDPAIYEYVVKELGFQKDEYLVIEDSTYGITAAKACGLKCLALRDDRFRFDQEKADHKIASLEKLLNYLD